MSESQLVPTCMFVMTKINSICSYIIGDVVSATAPGTTLIIMNTYQAARELLEKNSVHFSERPYLPLFDLSVVINTLYCVSIILTLGTCLSIDLQNGLGRYGTVSSIWISFAHASSNDAEVSERSRSGCIGTSHRGAKYAN